MASAPALRGGTVTFLFTDVEGSTALLKRVGRVRYHGLLARHQELVRSVLAAYYGEEVDTQGDQFFVAFASASDAVAAAADIQRSLVEDGEIRVRIGIHSGEASAAGGRYVGFSVHRAARIGAAAHGGQVLLSETTRTLVEDDLPPGVALRDLGPFRLKDIERPERITQLVIDGLPSAFPALGGARPLKPRPHRRGPLVAGALAGVIAAAVAIPVFALGGSGGGRALAGIGPDAVGAIDSAGHITASMAAGVSPTGVGIGAHHVWVTSADANRVVEIDPQTRAKVQTYNVGAAPVGIAYGGRFVWVANSLDGTLSQIDPQAQIVVGTPLKVGNGPTGVAYGDGSVWVADSGDRTVVQIDPTTRRIEHKYPAPLGADALAFGSGALWVVSESDGSVTRIDPRTGAPSVRVNVGNGPTAVAVGTHTVWVANGLDGTVTRINPATNSVADTIPNVGTSPSGIAFDDRTVWVSNEGSGTVSKIDPSTDEPTTVRTGNRPAGIAVAAGVAYVPVQASPLAHRGGTLRVVEAPPPSQLSEADILDPVKQASYQGYETLSLTNDGLVAFKHAGGTEGFRLVPDLAIRIPSTPTDGGKTYTFQLRSGIHYSDGRLVRPEDFRRTIRRTLLGPGGLYYTGIRGGEDCVTSKRCDLQKGIVTSGNTITFHLKAPDPDFLFKLAMPWAYAIPAHAGLPVPATGPYEITRFNLMRGMTLRRNPNFHQWREAAQPDGVPNKIVFDFPGTPESRTRAVEKGRADVLFDGVPAELLQEVQTRFATQTHIDPVLGTSFFVLNTQRPPFDNLQARRAVNYAIDRGRLVGLLGGPGIYYRPSCQLLPPGLEGYKRFCPFKHSLAKALALVADSGTGGAKVTVVGTLGLNGATKPMYRYFISVLRAVGYRARLKLVEKGNGVYDYTNDPRRMREAGGVVGWAADFPSPAGWLNPLVTCAAYEPRSKNNTNWPELCNRGIDDEIKSADRLQVTDFAAAGDRWAKIDHDVARQAAFVVLDNGRSLYLVSPRVGNYTYNMAWGVPFLDQLWVK